MTHNRNPWYVILLPELRRGHITMAQAARLAGVSRVRIGQWCFAAGFDAIEAQRHYLTTLYARGLLRMKRSERIKADVAQAMTIKARPKQRKTVSKKALRAMASDKVINFVEAGGKIKQIPKGKRSHPKPL